MVRNGQKHRHRIVSIKNTSASHRCQKLTIVQVYPRSLNYFEALCQASIESIHFSKADINNGFLYGRDIRAPMLLLNSSEGRGIHSFDFIEIQ